MNYKVVKKLNIVDKEILTAIYIPVAKLFYIDVQKTKCQLVR